MTRISKLSSKKTNSTLLISSTVTTFHEENCSESQRLVEPFFTFAEKIRELKINIKVAKIDVAKNNKTREDFSIEKTPTFSLLINSYSLPYKGEVSKDHLFNWTIAKIKNNVTEISEDDIAESILEKKETMKVIFNNQDELYDLNNFTILSKFYEEDIAFYYTKKASIARKFKMTMGTRLVFINDGDIIKHTGDTSVESLYDFIEESKNPLIEGLTESNVETLMDEERFVATFVVLMKKRESLDKTKEILKKLRRNEDYSDISFTWASSDDRAMGDQLIEIVGKKPKEFSFVFSCNSGTAHKTQRGRI